MEDNVGSVQTEIVKKNRKLPRLAGAACAALLVLSLLLPLFVAREEYAGLIDSYPGGYVDEQTGLSIRELKSISPVDYGRIYGKIFEGELEGALCVAIAAALGVAALLTLCLTALNKPIGALVFDVIAFAAFRLMAYDVSSRGLIESNWKWGIDYYLFPILAAVMAVLLIWMLVTKIKEKRQKKLTSTEA